MHVAQKTESRPHDRQRNELAEAMTFDGNEARTWQGDTPLSAVLLAGLGKDMFEPTPGLAVFSEAMSTMRALLALNQIGGFSDEVARDLDAALEAVRLRLETAYTLICIEQSIEKNATKKSDDDESDEPSYDAEAE